VKSIVRFLIYLPLILPLLLTGCGSVTPFMSAPNICIAEGIAAFDRVPEPLRSSDATVFFATDRFPEQESANARVHFGWSRSGHLYFGKVRATIGSGLTWTDVLELSTTSQLAPTAFTVQEPDIMLRYPGTFWRAARIEDPSRDWDHFQQRRLEARAEMHRILRHYLAINPKPEAFVFIHGFNNSFENGVEAMANLWHFMGRQGIPIAYSWPAGSGGLLGYATDWEAGDFTIFHLKMFLEDLAALPELKKIHILAHSRGTDVAMTAVRELVIEARGSGKELKESLKIGNIVLASPDIDVEVAGQRLSSERMPNACDRITIYLSPGDVALSLSTWLHRSVARLGFTDIGTYTKEQIEVLAAFPNLDMIDTRVSTDWMGHSFFHASTSASSDLILLLRDNRPPGKENGRPLEPIAKNLWRLNEGYPDIEPEPLAPVEQQRKEDKERENATLPPAGS